MTTAERVLAVLTAAAEQKTRVPFAKHLARDFGVTPRTISRHVLDIERTRKARRVWNWRVRRYVWEIDGVGRTG